MALDPTTNFVAVCVKAALDLFIFLWSFKFEHCSKRCYVKPKNITYRVWVMRFIFCMTIFKPIVKPMFTIELFSDFFLFCDYDNKHTAGVTGQQRIFTPTWHLVCSWFIYFYLDFKDEHRYLSPHFINVVISFLLSTVFPP